MKRGCCLVILFFMLHTVAVYANSIPPVIEHYPVQEAKEAVALTINAIITDEDGVQSASVYFRSARQVSYQQVIMQESGAVFSATIDSSYVSSPYLEYYIEAQDKKGNKSFLPKVNYISKPYYVKILPLLQIEKLSPSGNYTLLYRDASGKYSDLQPVPPGSITNFTFNTSFKDKNKNYSLWLNKDTEQFTVRTQNRFKIGMSDRKRIVTIGDFYANFSELSFPGIEIRRGISIKSNQSKNKYHIIIGHSQLDVEKSLKLSPVFKQYFVGLRQELNLSQKTSGTINLTYSKDDDDSISQNSGLLATKDTTGSVEVKHSLAKNINLSGEYAKNRHNDVTKTNDSAYQIKFETAIEKLDLTSSYKKIGDKFFTTATLSGITPTNTKGSMDNNKKGIFNTFEFRPLPDLLAITGTFDKYKQVSPDTGNAYLIKTKDEKIGINLTPKNIPGVSFRMGKLVRDKSTGGNESTSKSKSYGTNWTISDLGPLANVMASYTKQEIDYTSPLAKLNIDMDIGRVECAYKDKLSLSGSINKTKTKDLNAITTTKRDTHAFAANWNLVPEKWTVQVNTQEIKNKKSDGGVNNNERNYTLQINRYLSPTMILSASWKKIKYKDELDPVNLTDNSYNERIFTLKLTQNFWEITPKKKVKVAKEKEITEIKKEEIKIEKKEEIKEKKTEEIKKQEYAEKPTPPPTEEKKKEEMKKQEVISQIPQQREELQIKEGVIKPQIGKPVIKEAEEIWEEEEIKKIKGKIQKPEEKIPKYVIITTKKGESLQQIARKYYRNSSRYVQIIADNPGIYTYVFIAPGQRINITTPSGKEIVHKVVQGDTLFKIAKRYLGDGELFVEILRQNPQIRDVYTKPGQKIKIILEE